MRACAREGIQACARARVYARENPPPTPLRWTYIFYLQYARFNLTKSNIYCVSCSIDYDGVS